MIEQMQMKENWLMIMDNIPKSNQITYILCNLKYIN